MRSLLLVFLCSACVLACGSSPSVSPGPSDASTSDVAAPDAASRDATSIDATSTDASARDSALVRPDVILAPDVVRPRDAIVGNGACATAHAMANGETAYSIIDGSEAAACNQGRHARWFHTAAPAGVAIVVDIVTDGFLPSFGMINEACAASCNNEQVPGPGTVTLSFLIPSSPGAHGHYFYVGGGDAAGRGSFTVTTHQIPAQRNGVCSMARSVTQMDDLSLQNATDGRSGLDDVCLARAQGTNLFYRAHLEAGERLTLGASPRQMDIALRVLDSCGATDCLASGDQLALAIGEVTSFTNGDAPRDVIFTVGGVAEFFPTGLVDLSLVVARPYYETSTIDASCDSLPEGSVILTGEDDAVSSAMVPPMSLFLFGEEYLAFVVDSNGVAYLARPSDSFPTRSEWINSPVPNRGYDTAILAPFWDDLGPHATLPSSVSVARVGDHTTFEWGTFTIASDPGASLRFQAKLFPNETVEFHYCQMVGTAASTPPRRASGSSATIGMQALHAANVEHYSYQTPDRVATGRAIRFTKR